MSVYLQIPPTLSKWITGRRRKCTPINITCIFNTFSPSTSYFLPKFLFQVCIRKGSRTIISTSKYLVRHFLEIAECVVSEENIYINYILCQENYESSAYEGNLYSPSTHEKGKRVISIPFSQTKWLYPRRKFETNLLFHKNQASRN